MSPPLTTIRQPLVEMAEAAAELVLALARGDETQQTRIKLATELVVRESTAPLPMADAGSSPADASRSPGSPEHPAPRAL